MLSLDQACSDFVAESIKEIIKVIKDKREAAGLKRIKEEDLHFTNLHSKPLVNIAYENAVKPILNKDYKDSGLVRVETYLITEEGRASIFEFGKSKVKSTETMHQKPDSKAVAEYLTQNHHQENESKEVVCAWSIVDSYQATLD